MNNTSHSDVVENQSFQNLVSDWLYFGANNIVNAPTVLLGQLPVSILADGLTVFVFTYKSHLSNNLHLNPTRNLYMGMITILKDVVVYTAGAWFSYTFREIYRDYSDCTYYKLLIGFIGGVGKYAITKNFVDLAGIYQHTDKDYFYDLKKLLYVKIFIGGVNNAAYELALVKEQQYKENLKILQNYQLLYWYIIPQSIEVLETFLNNSYINFFISGNLFPEALQIANPFPLLESFKGTHFYTGIFGIFYSKYKSAEECTLRSLEKGLVFTFTLPEEELLIPILLLYTGSCYFSDFHDISIEVFNDNSMCNLETFKDAELTDNLPSDNDLSI
ncbi:hypothetical protein N3Z17_02830 [Candidatus Bandiella numerosa]|uniref:hypothetical protein n=1 Tax=Candidatus Bandiella numerosa TaxID=2570586 RepID=UPI00249F78A4|nr:hypothetical protein [Candidatus Bandiella numerosa]WHA05461.1 hypothetical protein N3Z17_02830 [Candidatus Bandiella numerosa]